LRATTTDELERVHLKARGAGGDGVAFGVERQYEEAWFLGLRLNAGVEIAALEREFGAAMVAPALDAVARLVEAGLLFSDGGRVWLSARGRLLSNDVFQEFLGLEASGVGPGIGRLRKKA
jgi:coproporphyrinogen III oxidase-like Fe-S oxidoreductase